MKLVVPLLLIFIASVNSKCLGVPLVTWGQISYNCISICCADGFVQDVVTGYNCVSCQSVGLVGCASCTLYSTTSSGHNLTYRCMTSNNIDRLITIGDSSKCVGDDQIFDGTYILNNWTNYDSCVRCNITIPGSIKCKLTSHCEILIA